MFPYARARDGRPPLRSLGGAGEPAGVGPSGPAPASARDRAEIVYWAIAILTTGAAVALVLIAKAGAAVVIVSQS